MKKKTVCLYLLGILALMTAACSGDGKRGEGQEEQLSDTGYTEKAVLEIYGRDPKRALSMIDSGMLAGTLSVQRATLLRATVYCYSSDEWPLDTINQMLEELLRSDFVKEKPGNRQEVLDLLVGISRRRGDNVAYLRWATERANFCYQQGKETEALRTEAEIGAVLTRMGEVEKGLARLDGVIGALDNQRHFNEMDACIIALKRKIFVLSELDRYDEVIPLAKQMVAKLNDYRAHPSLYDDGSFRMPATDERRLGYCDFYASQAYSYLMIAYAEINFEFRNSNSEIQHSKFKIQNYQDSARHYLALFEGSDYAKTLNGRMMLSTAYLCLGQYDQVLPIYDEVEACMGDDTLSGNYANNLRGRAIIAEAAGNYRDANSYWKRYGNLKEILNRQLLESRAYEYATRYQLKEEDLKSERLKVKSEQNKLFAIAVSAFALLVVLSCVWLLFSRRTINRKNRKLAEQLADITRRGVPPCTPENDALDVHGGTPLPEPSDINAFTPSDINALTDEQLFKYLSEVIRKEKLFTDPGFGRQTLVDRFKLSDRRIGAAFAQGSQYASITEFTRELRLEYACRLLTERTDMNISDIAAACGFGSPIVFNRVFKAKHEITPTYYREQVAGRG